MGEPIRALIVEDSEDDAQLIVLELQRGGFDGVVERVETEDAMSTALASQTWDIVLADYTLPHFDMFSAWSLLKTRNLDVPFIIVSGTIGERKVVEAMRAGIHDYLFKNDLTRLCPAVRRTLAEAKVRHARRQAEEALRASEERYRTLVETVPHGIEEIDASGTILVANAAHHKQYEYADGALVGMSILDLVATDSAREELPHYLNFLVTEQPPPTPYVGQKRTKQGKVIDVEVAWNYKRDAQGQVTGFTSVVTDITERKRAEQQMRESRERLRSLANRLDTVREEERTLMAREIHDQVGQALTSLKMDLSWLVDKLPKNQKAARGRASSMISVVETTLESVRDLSSRLRPAILDDLGLEAAIEWQAEEFTSRTGCNCTLDLRAGELGLSHDRDTTVFRILQEALTNVARHAEASRVEISLQTPPGQLVLEVRDDGKGIPREKLASGMSLGLVSMHERAGALGGEVGLHCPAEGGTVLSLRLPIAAERS